MPFVRRAICFPFNRCKRSRAHHVRMEENAILLLICFHFSIYWLLDQMACLYTVSIWIYLCMFITSERHRLLAHKATHTIGPSHINVGHSSTISSLIEYRVYFSFCLCSPVCVCVENIFRLVTVNVPVVRSFVRSVHSIWRVSSILCIATGKYKRDKWLSTIWMMMTLFLLIKRHYWKP